MPDVFSILTSPWVIWGVIALVAMLAYQKLAPRLSLRVPGLPKLSVDGLLTLALGSSYTNAKLEREVARLRKTGHVLAAGRLYEDAGRHQKAIDVYLAGDEPFAAAGVLERTGKSDKAAELYLQAGDFKKAAEVFVASGRPGKAAALFESKGHNLDAARLYAEAGAWDRAGELFLKAGFLARAAEAFEKKGDLLRAAESLERHFMENVTYATTYSSTAASPEQKAALKAGELYRRAGELKRAREILTRGSFFSQAAAVCMELGEYEKAGELYLREENFEGAATAFEKGGDPVRAANLRGEIAFKAGETARAAAAFVAGQDYLRAAELYESVGMLAEAAGAFETAGSYAAAGGVYLRANLKRQAAAAYEKGGEYATAGKLYEEEADTAKAVELFEKAGMTFKSGQAAAAAGDRERAIALLQRVPAGDENYRAATELLVRLFIEADRPGLAVERLQKALAGQQVAPENVELFYWLAVGLERGGHAVEAATVYKRVLAEDFNYRDAQARLTQLQSPSAAAPGQAPPSAPTGPRAAAGDAGAAPIAAQFGKYRLLKALGQGAMGKVYLARDTMLEREVALKVMTGTLGDDADLKTRFEREARAVARMTHPNVVTVHDLGYSADGYPYIAMELLRGTDLRTALRQTPPLSVERRILVLIEVLAGLGHAHEAGIVHRDIKPANVFLCQDGAVKILDFGVARLTATGSASASAAGGVGTADYMSPEQVRGTAVDPRSDLFGVGCMLFELVTGRRPFRGDDIMSIFYKITHEQPDWSVWPEAAAAASLRPIVEKALAKEPDQRYPSATAFAADLRAWLVNRRQARSSGTAARPATAPPPAPAAAPSSAPPPPAAASASPAGSSPAPKAAAAPAAAAESTPPPSGPAAAVPAAKANAARAVQRLQKHEEVGRGPLGVVHRGEDAQGRALALRFLPPALLDGDVLQPLLVELKAAAQVSHPNVARVMGFLELEGQRCVVSELATGRSCAEPLQGGRRMALQQVLSLARGLASAVAAIHAKQLVHGSIQPSNVMLGGGSFKLCDLGLGLLALAAVPDSPYRAPERRLDVAGDVFALSATLYHLLTGRLPSLPNVALPSQVVPGLASGLDSILLRGLHPQADARFAGVGELAQALGKLG